MRTLLNRSPVKLPVAAVACAALPVIRSLFKGFSLSLALLLSMAASAHDFRVGGIRVDHPYALPASGSEGLLCLRELRNTGSSADRLLAVRTGAAKQVQAPEGQTLPLLLPAGASLRLRHDAASCLRLQGLQQSLQAGESFEAVLQFERAGELSIRVDVQQAKLRSPH